MIKFEVEEFEGLTGEIGYKFTVGNEEEMVVCQLFPPNGVLSKKELAFVCYQLANQFSDNHYSNGMLEGHKVIMDLLAENKELKDALKL